MYKLGGGGNLIWHGDKNQLSKKTWLSLKFPLGLIDIFVQWEISKTKEIPGLSVCSMIGMLLRANECIFAWHFKLKWRCVLFINLLSLVVLISAVLPASLHQLAVSPGCQKEFPVWVFGVCVFPFGFLERLVALLLGLVLVGMASVTVISQRVILQSSLESQHI